MPKVINLNIENVDQLSDNLSNLTYDRNKIKTGIAHIGVSNFHRAHQAFYIHELIEKYGDYNYGICGIDLRENDRKIYNILKDQDGLYSLHIKDASGVHKTKVIGSIVEYFYGPENPMAVIERLSKPDIKIISLTIAEDGYHLNEITGEFDQKHPEVAEDIKNPFDPKTVFGYLTQAFKLRKLRGIAGCTILSCDNIKANGNTMQKSFYNYVDKNEPDLLPWLKKNTTFPNTMVDRITPETQPKDVTVLKKEYALNDQWPVVCESFTSWIIEDNFFNNQRPQWEKVGVQFVEKVAHYENLKLLLLNAGHTILGILGTLNGYKTVQEAANDKDFMIFLKSYMDNEVSPILNHSGIINLEKYKKTLVSRFKNPYINDSLSRICSESSSKVPLFILPTLKQQLTQDHATIANVSFLIAAWCVYYDGVNDHGNPYKITDNLSNTLVRMAALSQQNPIKFLEIEPVFNVLNKNEIFVAAFVKYLNYIRKHTIKDAIKDFNASKI